MKVGCLLDNLNSPADSSFAKLATMQATAVGTLWTGGTRHRRWIYEKCESLLTKPLYILRIGGHHQSPAEWIDWAREALAEVPSQVLFDARITLTCGNEPNIEFQGAPEEYGALYKEVAGSSVPVLFAAPSVGMAYWREWWYRALMAAGTVKQVIANLYQDSLGAEAEFTWDGRELYIGEINSAANVQGPQRIEWLQWAFDWLAKGGKVKAALVFIAGGQSNGAWDERYILSEQEAAGLKWEDNDMVTARIGNLDVEDLRAALPDEAGKMLPVVFTTKDFISVHHTVTPPTTDPIAARAAIGAIYRYHLSKGWGGIGYNFVVDGAGGIYYVGECNTERAAVGQIAQGNRRGLHVAMLGDLTNATPPAPMLAAVKLLIANIQHAYGWFMPVVPHRLFNSNGPWDTECPGSQWRQWWQHIIRAVGD